MDPEAGGQTRRNQLAASPRKMTEASTEPPIPDEVGFTEYNSVRAYTVEGITVLLEECGICQSPNGDRWYRYGGYCMNDGQRVLNSELFQKPQTVSSTPWSRLDASHSTVFPPFIRAHTLTALSDKVVVFGGKGLEQNENAVGRSFDTGKYTNLTYVFHLSQQLWEKVTPTLSLNSPPSPSSSLEETSHMGEREIVISPRCYHSAVAVRSDLCVWGGLCSDGRPASTTLWRLRFKADVNSHDDTPNFGDQDTGSALGWSPVNINGAHPTARWQHQSAAFGSRIFIFGGRGFSNAINGPPISTSLSSPECILNDLWTVALNDGEDCRWETIDIGPSVPPRFGHLSFVDDGKWRIRWGVGVNGKLYQDDETMSLRLADLSWSSVTSQKGKRPSGEGGEMSEHLNVTNAEEEMGEDVASKPRRSKRRAQSVSHSAPSSPINVSSPRAASPRSGISGDEDGKDRSDKPTTSTTTKRRRTAAAGSMRRAVSPVSPSSDISSVRAISPGRSFQDLGVSTSDRTNEVTPDTFGRNSDEITPLATERATTSAGGELDDISPQASNSRSGVRGRRASRSSKPQSSRVSGEIVDYMIDGYGGDRDGKQKQRGSTMTISTVAPLEGGDGGTEPEAKRDERRRKVLERHRAEQLIIQDKNKQILEIQLAALNAKRDEEMRSLDRAYELEISQIQRRKVAEELQQLRVKHKRTFEEKEMLIKSHEEIRQHQESMRKSVSAGMKMFEKSFKLMASSLKPTERKPPAVSSEEEDDFLSSEEPQGG
eukprot:GHVN01083812.1.p1 GENE.GHVN01083812.1~~GHVN01083812.1.p1  ORF type:complete len:770 (+),score=191.88 GHVN01083812.1:72-2381(+)